MATRVAQRRLTKEYKALQESPTPYIEAHPNEQNILEWYYIITGPPDTPFEGGEYLGTLVFPPDYPFKPPAIRMVTPSGRFQPNVRLCLSMSDYHPNTWNPAWSVSTILTGLLSFMNGDELTTGGLMSSTNAKRQLAKDSHAWNLENDRYRAMFPHLLPDSDKTDCARPQEAGGVSKRPGTQPLSQPASAVGLYVLAALTIGLGLAVAKYAW